MSRPFFDTSILIGGLIDFGPRSAAAQRLLEAVAEGSVSKPSTAWHCCLEFYAVTTRLPGQFRLAPEQVWSLLDAEVLGRFHVSALRSTAQRSFLRSAAHAATSGGRIYDAHIGEIARRQGCDVLVTENIRHFARGDGAGPRILRAAELVAELAL